LDLSGNKNQERKTRYHGLHLGGPKSDKTCLVVFDVFREKNQGDYRFLVDIFDQLSSPADHEADWQLLAKIQENSENLRAIGVDAPLTLPPFFSCHPECPGFEECTNEGVVWLREEILDRQKGPRKGKRVRPMAPYVERPVDVYLRRFLDEGFGQIAVIEALGASMASKTARMQYVQKQTLEQNIHWVETNPTLSLFMLKDFFKLSTRDLKYYRDLELGASIRMRILDKLNDQKKVFLYEKDLGQLVASIPAFYAFLNAYTAYLDDLGWVQKPPEGFPAKSGWLAIPEIQGDKGPTPHS
jgi:hypothetical protein